MFNDSIIKRFWSKVDRRGDLECWPWHGTKANNGYSLIAIDRVNYGAHRLSYAIARGDIPEGMVIDHLCRNKWCTNPNHLEAVSARDNVLRGIGYSAMNARKVACRRGHPLTGDNLYPKNGRRHCRTCRNLTRRLKRAQKARGGGDQLSL